MNRISLQRFRSAENRILRAAQGTRTPAAATLISTPARARVSIVKNKRLRICHRAVRARLGFGRSRASPELQFANATRQNGQSESAARARARTALAPSVSRRARNLLTLSQILRLTDSRSRLPGLVLTYAGTGCILQCNAGEPLPGCPLCARSRQASLPVALSRSASVNPRGLPPDRQVDTASLIPITMQRDASPFRSAIKICGRIF